MTEGNGHGTFHGFDGAGERTLSADGGLRLHLVIWGVVVAGLSLLTACGHQPPPLTAQHETRRLEADFDQAWDAAIRVLTERGYQVVVANQTSGILETDWQTINPEYAASVFVTQYEDRYANCGKPSLGQAFQGKQALLELALSQTRRRSTEVTIRARFRTHRFTDLLWRGDQVTVECQSRGRLEDEVAMLIQLQLVGEHLERLRRGIP